jgi:hypothetical protein
LVINLPLVKRQALMIEMADRRERELKVSRNLRAKLPASSSGESGFTETGRQGAATIEVEEECGEGVALIIE